jgi:hypothetical protein
LVHLQRVLHGNFVLIVRHLIEHCWEFDDFKRRETGMDCPK